MCKGVGVRKRERVCVCAIQTSANMAPNIKKITQANTD